MSRQTCALLLVLIFIFQPSSVHARARTDREKAGLFGPVKTVRLEQAEMREQDGAWVESGRRLESIAVYDEEGREVEVSNYFNGTFQSKRITTHDSPGSVTLTYYNYQENLTGRTVLTFDAAGRSTGSLTYDADGNLSRQENYVYDHRGELLESSYVFVNNPAFSGKTIYSYDDAGRSTGSMVYDADGVLKQKNTYTPGTMKVIQYNTDGSTKGWEANISDASFEFDSHNNWTKRTFRRKVTESGKTRELVEITYRTITYH